MVLSKTTKNAKVCESFPVYANSCNNAGFLLEVMLVFIEVVLRCMYAQEY